MVPRILATAALVLLALFMPAAGGGSRSVCEPAPPARGTGVLERADSPDSSALAARNVQGSATADNPAVHRVRRSAAGGPATGPRRAAHTRPAQLDPGVIRHFTPQQNPLPPPSP